MAILKPQTSNPVYHYNCQGNCILFYENNLCKNKEAEIGQKQKKKKKRKSWGWEVPTHKITITVIYISFKNLLT